MSNQDCKQLDVSFIIAAHNSADFIKESINSALLQTNVSFEIIIIDDASSDTTFQVVSSLNNPHIKLFRSEINVGPGGARNIALKHARGKWISILDSDDTILPERLSVMLNAASKNTDIIIDHLLQYDIKTGKLNRFYNSSELKLGLLTLSSFIRTNLIFTKIKSSGYLKPIFKNTFLKRNNIHYWPDVRIGEDYYFLAKCLANGAVAKVIDYAGYIYTDRPDSISSVLTEEHISKLLKADDHFIRECSNFDHDSYKSQLYRTNNLNKGLYYLKIVNSIKNRSWLAALKIGITHPQSALLLWLPIRKRLLGY